MNLHHNDLGREIFTLEDIVKSGLEFEALVRAKQAELHLPPGSEIERAALAALKMLESFKLKIAQDAEQDDRNEWRRAVALGDMLRKVLNVAKHPSFDQLWPHVMLLLGNSNIALNVWNPKEDSEANKIFELYIALVLARLSSVLHLDHPLQSSGGRNPDVIARIDNSRWAFSCKVMHSASPKSFLDRLREGIDQIKRADADKGVVVISLKNLLPHDHYWMLKRDRNGLADFICPGAIDLEIVTRDLLKMCKDYHHKVIDDLLGGPAAFDGLFVGTPAVPAVLLHLCTTIAVPDEGKLNFCFVRMFCSLNATHLPSDVHRILTALNNSLHGRLSDFSPPEVTAT
jgi:hypothetical protein